MSVKDNIRKMIGKPPKHPELYCTNCCKKQPFTYNNQHPSQYDSVTRVVEYTCDECGKVMKIKG
ncbi:MAG: hypothetical protein ACOCP8_03380 [archaeon]